MGTQSRAGRPDAANVAKRVLAAHRAGELPGLRQVFHTQALVHGMTEKDTCEAEKMELLMGAIESLESSGAEQSEAAVRLLEHLSKGAAARSRR
jgi:hypothetical protein